MSELKYRHNVMNISSLNAFLSVKSGCANDIRDVYFVRGVGETADINELLEKADRRMDLEMSYNRLKYCRLSGLPQLRETADANYYSSIYEDLTYNNLLKLKNVPSNDWFKLALSKAMKEVVEIYQKHKKAASPSMGKNFAVKLLYWLDTTVYSLFVEWNEKSCIKVIADNVTKEQEYLFYLMLTYLGCDVFLVQNRVDVDAPEELLKYSYMLRMGDRGNTQINAYVKKEPQRPKQVVKTPFSTDQVQANKKVVIPERPGRKKKNAANSEPSNSKVTINVIQSSNSDVKKAGNSLAGNSLNEEKNFEELAQLASSVVLIAMHDSNGDIVGTGSGIMIGRKGFILTNNHVVSGGRFYSVRIEDDEEVYTTTEVIKYNSTTDLAVIRIDRVLKPIPIYDGRKKLVRGQKVVAIGSPLGLFNSVSDGIISGFRNINNVDMIQFTAPISHGSSGGAVLNMYGEVIGISTAGIDSGQNINLAIGYENIRMFINGFTF